VHAVVSVWNVEKGREEEQQPGPGAARAYGATGARIRRWLLDQ
jgi:hypothetical protein